MVNAGPLNVVNVPSVGMLKVWRQGKMGKHCNFLSILL